MWYFSNQTLYELQNAFDDLYEESIKIGSKNSMLKKLVASLTKELDKLKLHASKIKNENESLHAKIENLTKCLKNSHKDKRI